ncbi:MAG: phosphate ABC transporter permease subunit PstC, partial [Eubacteriales bacterium]|nr:phosphate ABC transporter permease subunit PstC [Eubacteriales bacterium]
MENLFQLCALVSIAAVATITVYLFVSGVPAMFKIGFREFLLGTVWRPTEGQFGILPMILTSIVSTLLAVAIGSVIGVMTAICMVEIAPAWLTKILRPCIELLAGIPSVVYGYFGLMLIVPLITKVSGFAGNSLLAVIIILSMMILPTIINISETALRAVPRAYKEGSLALGASGIQTIFKVLLPAARSGVLSAIVLGIGRAIGETMAVILVAGNTPRIPTSLFDSVRTLTINIAFEMRYAQGLH